MSSAQDLRRDRVSRLSSPLILRVKVPPPFLGKMAICHADGMRYRPPPPPVLNVPEAKAEQQTDRLGFCSCNERLE
ncbi:hypothetical protein NQZ68_017626 [Dissostichus eleginoides]|nr:hypothetical protein NQZ68_017626 [Dissostichus eleginoides]